MHQIIIQKRGKNMKKLVRMEQPHVLQFINLKFFMRREVFDFLMEVMKSSQSMWIWLRPHGFSHIHILTALILNYRVVHNHTNCHDHLQCPLIPKSNKSRNDCNMPNALATSFITASWYFAKCCFVLHWRFDIIFTNVGHVKIMQYNSQLAVGYTWIIDAPRHDLNRGLIPLAW
jgi:hypothetical protein